jgi:hypothetical protein
MTSMPEPTAETGGLPEAPEPGKLEWFLNVLRTFTVRHWAALITVAVVCAVGGHTFGRWRTEEEVKTARLDELKTSLDSQRASIDLAQRLSAENANLRQDVSQKINELNQVRIQQLGPSFDPLGSDLTPLDHAPLKHISLEEFAKLRIDARKDATGKTELQLGEFYKPYLECQFEWTGFVHDVWMQGKGSMGLLLGAHPPVKELVARQSEGAVNCFFGSKESGAALEHLDRGQKIKIVGVMGPYGYLARCKILDKIGEPEFTHLMPVPRALPHLGPTLPPSEEPAEPAPKPKS